jgi:hypothetical protein
MQITCKESFRIIIFTMKNKLLKSEEFIPRKSKQHFRF